MRTMCCLYWDWHTSLVFRSGYPLTYICKYRMLILVLAFRLSLFPVSPSVENRARIAGEVRSASPFAPSPLHVERPSGLYWSCRVYPDHVEHSSVLYWSCRIYYDHVEHSGVLYRRYCIYSDYLGSPVCWTGAAGFTTTTSSSSVLDWNWRPMSQFEWTCIWRTRCGVQWVSLLVAPC
jgi:hypothetical protein